MQHAMTHSSSSTGEQGNANVTILQQSTKNFMQIRSMQQSMTHSSSARQTMPRQCLYPAKKQQRSKPLNAPHDETCQCMNNWAGKPQAACRVSSFTVPGYTISVNTNHSLAWVPCCSMYTAAPAAAPPSGCGLLQPGQGSHRRQRLTEHCWCHQAHPQC
jgi:hypothetical protein